MIVPDVWTKRDRVPDEASDYEEIWDHHLGWWQINRNKHSGKFILLDALMPWDAPASPVVGTFLKLEEAQEKADQEGKPDWDEWIEVYGDGSD